MKNYILARIFHDKYPLDCLLVWLVFKSHYVAPGRLELDLQSKLVSDSGIKGVHHHSQPISKFLKHQKESQLL